MALRKEKLTLLYFTKIITHFLFVQVYVDDIIFDATNDMLCEDFSKLI